MEKSIPIMLDSTILKQVPKLNSALFNELVKYIRADIYSFYVSEIVEQEYISWIRGEAQNSYDLVAKATNSLNKYYEEPSILGFKFEFNSTTSIAANHINGILKKVNDNWISFKERTKATVIPIYPEHGKTVMDAYFSGGKPFSKIKNRNDIPDAFIFCALNELLKSNEKVIFISSDKKFTEEIQCENIICFENFSNLFNSGSTRLDARFFSSLEGDNKFFTLFRIYEDEIQRKLVSEIEFSDITDIIDDMIVEEAVGEYSDISTNVIHLIKKFDEATSISEFTYLVPFEAKAKCTVDSYATRDEIAMINQQRLNNIDKEVDDDGNFKVSECYFYNFSGHFSVKFDDSDPSLWKEQKKEGIFEQLEIQEITVTLEDIQQDA
jgi:hypothetical protein